MRKKGALHLEGAFCLCGIIASSTRCLCAKLERITVEFVAFFRNVNLGQPGSPTRSELEAAFQQAGARTPHSFMSNGTLIFGVPSDDLAEPIAAGACEMLRNICGMVEPVFVRNLSLLAGYVAQDPFAEWHGEKISEYAITFFDVAAALPVQLPIESERKDCLVFRVDAGDAFCVSREVNGKTGYPTPVIEKALGVPATTRSWTTILRLVKKYA